MKYCHECGSEVADNDLFCPYCGILQPTTDESVPVDDPLASTIVISSGSVPELPQISERLVDPYISDASLSIATSKTEESIRVETPPVEVGFNLERSRVDADETVANFDHHEAVTGHVLDETLEEPLDESGTSQIASAEIPTPILLATSEVSIDIEDSTAGVIDPEEFKISDSEEAIEDNFEQVSYESDTIEDDVENFHIKSSEAELTVGPSVEEAKDSNEAEVSEGETPPVGSHSPAIPDADTKSESLEDKSPGDVGSENSLVADASDFDLSDSAFTSDEPVTLFSAPENVGTIDDASETDFGEEPIPVSNEPIADDLLSGDTEEELDTNSGSESVISNTGDDLIGEKSASQTTPRIGAIDTDGRKSGLKPLPEGTILNNRYDIVRKIGGGGMGAVYLATDRNLGGVTRAVKEMVQSHIEEEQQEKAIDDFKRESMILSTLDHPSIPTIYDYFFDEQESRFYLVMKYISGGDLAGRLRAAPEGRIDERTVIEWALQVIDVLDYLHNLPATIVYRDLKPSNIMIDGNSGRTMLIDFGIARSINQNQEKGVTAVGTMGYAPPELFSGNVEPRSDIYSLGSTMFHLLTGADPQNNPLLIFDFQKNPRPRQINPQLSDQIERILMRSVEYNADARFASAAEMKRALSDHLEALKIGQITFGVTEIPLSVSLSNQVVFCGFCGQRIVATDMFCAFCGSKQPLAQHGVHSEVYSSRSTGSAKLVLVGTSELDSPAYAIEKLENLVGRRDPMSNIFPEVDLSKYDPQTKISRRHAKIWRDGQNYLVEDLGSSNGTILLTSINDTMRLIPHQPHPLVNGDRLRVGDTTLHFIIG